MGGKKIIIDILSLGEMDSNRWNLFPACDKAILDLWELSNSEYEQNQNKRQILLFNNMRVL